MFLNDQYHFADGHKLVGKGSKNQSVVLAILGVKNKTSQVNYTFNYLASKIDFLKMLYIYIFL